MDRDRRFLIEIPEYSSEKFGTASELINNCWFWPFTVSLFNISNFIHGSKLTAGLNHGTYPGDVQAIVCSEAPDTVDYFTAGIKYLRNDFTISVKESMFGSVQYRPRVLLIPMVLKSNLGFDKLIVYLGDVQKMADCRSSVPSQRDGSTMTYIYNLTKLNNCRLGMVDFRVPDYDLSGLFEFYHVTGRLYSMFYNAVNPTASADYKEYVMRQLYEKITTVVTRYNDYIHTIFGEAYPIAA